MAGTSTKPSRARSSRSEVLTSSDEKREIPFRPRFDSSQILTSQDRNGETGLFSRLPGELQNQIFLHLDSLSALFLPATNRYFRDVINPPVSTRAERLTCLREQELLPGKDDYFGCTKCWLLKPRSAFGSPQVRKRRAKGHSQSHKRFCKDCGVSKRIYTPGTFVEFSAPADSGSVEARGTYAWQCCGGSLQLRKICEICGGCELCALSRSFCFPSCKQCSSEGYCLRGWPNYPIEKEEVGPLAAQDGQLLAHC
ncbi:hypothetical protein IWX50DRAFT_692791 [Phyllosticta citricarpa]|uniref:F-box domain-containing protein n=1 Tax=Phyllosticta citricarpa TaxID=55181 RepID=A0ABR1MDC7_9PEZI